MDFRLIFGAQPATKHDFSGLKRPDAAAKPVVKEETYELTVVIKEADDENPDPNRVFVTAEVYAPNIPDSDGEFMTAVEIKKAAFDFLRKGRQDQIDVMHDGFAVDGVCMVESFIARKDDPIFREGAWVATVDVDNPELTQKIRKGELNGFSFEAMVNHSAERRVEMDIPPVVRGQTSKSDGHDHEVYVHWDENGRFKGGTTGPGPDGHTHEIKRGTATEVAKGHSHRFDAIEGVTVLTLDDR